MGHQQRHDDIRQTVVLCSDRELGKTIQHFLEVNYKLTLSEAGRGEALGIEVAANTSKRVAKVIKDRIRKGAKRNRRIQFLAKQVKGAGRLFSAGTLPQATYGMQVGGLSSLALQSFDTLASKASGSAGLNPCSISVADFRLCKIPSVQLQVRQLETWIT